MHLEIVLLYVLNALLCVPKRNNDCSACLAKLQWEIDRQDMQKRVGECFRCLLHQRDMHLEIVLLYVLNALLCVPKRNNDCSACLVHQDCGPSLAQPGCDARLAQCHELPGEANRTSKRKRGDMRSKEAIKETSQNGE